jgi:hypothetical protein
MPNPLAAPRLTTCAMTLCLLAVAGCTTSPRDYAAALSPQDPKWQSPECIEMRTAAQTYGAGQKPPLSWGAGALLGPYGLAIAAASKEHQEKQRKRFARDTHLACSSRPVPKELEVAVDLPPAPGQVVR